MLDIQTLTVGALGENAYLVRASAHAREAVFIDPGAEGHRLLAALEDLDATLTGVLLTHTHFDHVGAVAELAEATGADVWVPELEHHDLLTIDALMRAPGGMGDATRTGGGPPFVEYGPFRPYDAERTVVGGDVVDLAGITFDVVFSPGHSPGHVMYAPGDERCVFSGDVLYRGSIGRTDLPGGDEATLHQSIAALMAKFPAQTVFYPGHLTAGTLGEEARTNPCLPR